MTLIVAMAVPPAQVRAQEAAPVAKAKPAIRPAPTKKPPRDKYGTPLDTIMSTHLTTTAPPAEDFVRATHPAEKDLDYTPLTGIDPVRPKPRDKANVMALQAELEQAGTIAKGKGGAIGGGPAKAKRHKPATE